jgi:hypothetical protein
MAAPALPGRIDMVDSIVAAPRTAQSCHVLAIFFAISKPCIANLRQGIEKFPVS